MLIKKDKTNQLNNFFKYKNEVLSAKNTQTEEKQEQWLQHDFK
jgi:hypothetical protein